MSLILCKCDDFILESIEIEIEFEVSARIENLKLRERIRLFEIDSNALETKRFCNFSDILSEIYGNE